MSAVEDQLSAATRSHASPTMLPLASPTDTYWELSRRPLMSLLFVLPIMLAYELGVLTLGRDSLRNAADVWSRQFLHWLGFEYYFLLPLLVCGVLLGWHHVRHDPWQIRPRVLGVMWLEAIVWSVALLAIAQVMGRWVAFAGHLGERSTWSKFVGYFGAGLYEELLFRLLLLSGIALAAQRAGLNRRGSLLTAIGISSVLFAAVHYRIDLPFGLSIGTEYGDRVTLYSSLFRIAAGVFFGCLFVYRGFGIVVGAHALYDLLVLVTQLFAPEQK
jgi:membrane protease YdiL (CAAX protease family)